MPVTIDKKINLKSVARSLFLIFSCGILCLAGEYWIEIAVTDGLCGKSCSDYEFNKLYFYTTLFTSVFAFNWILLFFLRSINKLLGILSFILNIIVIILWLSITIYVCTRKF